MLTYRSHCSFLRASFAIAKRPATVLLSKPRAFTFAARRLRSRFHVSIKAAFLAIQLGYVSHVSKDICRKESSSKERKFSFWGCLSRPCFENTENGEKFRKRGFGGGDEGSSMRGRRYQYTHGTLGELQAQHSTSFGVMLNCRE